MAAGHLGVRRQPVQRLRVVVALLQPQLHGGAVRRGVGLLLALHAEAVLLTKDPNPHTPTHRDIQSVGSKRKTRQSASDGRFRSDVAFQNG